jgi:DNA-binding transcriptional regulator YhcF (GntR family)
MTQEIPTKLVINCETGEREIIPLTEEEIAERELMQLQAIAEQEQREADEAAKAAAKASAISKLAALGLSDAEIAALVG